MTNALSKIFNSIDHNCYESVHPYDPSCLKAFLLLVSESAKGGLKIYLPIFLIPQLLSIKWRNRKSGQDDETLITEIYSRIKKVATKISISTAVLAANSSLVLGLTCVQNHATGKVFYLSPFYSSMIAHFFSFQLETSSRRNALAMFAVKSSFEILYRIVDINFPILKSVYGEDFGSSLLFGLSIGINMYLMNTTRQEHEMNRRDPLKALLRTFLVGADGIDHRNVRNSAVKEFKDDDQDGNHLLLGNQGIKKKKKTDKSGGYATQGARREVKRQECQKEFRGDPSYRTLHNNSNTDQEEKEEGKETKKGVKKRNKHEMEEEKEGKTGGDDDYEDDDDDGSHPDYEDDDTIYDDRIISGGSRLCPHLTSSTKTSSRHLMDFLTSDKSNSCTSYACRGGIKVLIAASAIQATLSILRKRRSPPLDNLRLPLFLSSLVMSYRATSCLLRHPFSRTTKVKGLIESVAGLTSGFLSMYTFYPSTQISLYAFWKTIFTLYWTRMGSVRYAQKMLDGMFFLADSFLINCMVMEPDLVPRSYLRFIDSITGNYLTKFNIISHFLLTERRQVSRYGDQLPILDVDHLSRRYLELAGDWTIDQMK